MPPIRQPAGKTRLKTCHTRGNILHQDPGKKTPVSMTINCIEIGKACDAFLEARVPGYRAINFGGLPSKPA